VTWTESSKQSIDPQQQPVRDNVLHQQRSTTSTSDQDLPQRAAINTDDKEQPAATLTGDSDQQ